ncbi:MAG: hypothetical protein AAB353_03245 [Candidatus Hydrogenedentota bacterium]
MHARLVPAIVLATASLAFSGCLAEVLTTTAIQGELAAQNAVAATRALDYAKDSTARVNLRHALNAYQASNGTFPPTLDALAPSWIEAVPTQSDGTPFNYDSIAGTFWGGPGAATSAAATGPTDYDLQKISYLNQVVARYGAATGFYPPSLQALVDTGYMPKVPKTQSGEEFVYYSQNGAIYHPAELNGATATTTSAETNQQSLPNRGPGAGGGAGLLGETTTAIGIQNQLGNMGSGASQTGSIVRQDTRDQTGNYSEKQMKTLDDLDL